jgi:hypothetical protein
MRATTPENASYRGGNANYSGNRTANVNNYNRNVNVNGYGGGYYGGGYHGGGWGCCGGGYYGGGVYHPVAAGMAVGAAAAVTSAAIGSMVSTLPSGCSPYGS